LSSVSNEAVFLLFWRKTLSSIIFVFSLNSYHRQRMLKEHLDEQFKSCLSG